MDVTIFKDFSVLLNAVGVGNCFLLAVAYLGKKPSNALSVNHILALFFFILGIVTLNTILNFSSYNYQLYGYEPISNAVAFGIAPLLYLYIRSLKEKTNLPGLRSVHLWPLYGFTTLTIYCLLLPTTLFGVWGSAFLDSLASHILWNLHFLVYLIVIVLEIKKTKQQLPPTAKIIVAATASIWGLNLLLFIYRTWIDPLPGVVHLNITLLFSVLTIYIFYKKIGIGVEPLVRVSPRKRAVSQNVNHATDPIAKAIRKHKYYANPDLDIRGLSEQLQLPYHELSSHINANYGQNFNCFINAFRIEDVVQALNSRQHQSYTIMGLAEKAGFKSASAFYAAFKREKGTTPSTFLKQSA